MRGAGHADRWKPPTPGRTSPTLAGQQSRARARPASAASSVRLRAPVLRSTAPACFSTVFTDSTSRSAMTLSGRPCSIRSRTSRSRSVRRVEVVGPQAAVQLPEHRAGQDRLAAAGRDHGPGELRAVRRRRRRSRARRPASRRRPARRRRPRRAPPRRGRGSCAEQQPGHPRLRGSQRPAGRPRSTSATSGRSAWQASSACAAVPTSPTTSIPGSVQDSSRARPARSTGRPAATSTRSRRPGLLPVPPVREAGADPGAPARQASRRRRSRPVPGALGHGPQPEALALPAGLRVEALAVVLDEQRHGAVLVQQAEPDAVRLGVPDDVGQRLPGDPRAPRGRARSTVTGGPADTNLTSSRPMLSAQAASARSAASSVRPSSGDAASPSSVSRASASASLAAALACRDAPPPIRSPSVAGLAARPGAVEVHLDADQPLGERVVHLAEQPVALGRRRLGPGPFLGRLVHPGVGQRDRRVLGEQAEQFGVVGPEGARVVPAEHDARADDRARATPAARR